MAALGEIEKRHAQRMMIFKNARQLKPPVITDFESVKENTKVVKDNQVDLLEACTGIDYDVQVLLSAGRELARRCSSDFDRVIESEWSKQRVDEETQSVLDRRKMEEAEERAKEAKERGEVPGQMKMFKDDGGEAEPAGEVKIYKMEDRR